MVLPDRAAMSSGFGDLVHRHQDRVFNLCLRLCGDSHEAADLAQEVFLKAFASVDRFDQRSSVFTWLYRIAVNLSIDRRRHARRRPAVSWETLAAAADRDAAAGSLSTTQAGPERRSLDAERRRVVEQALARLPDEQRALVVLRDVEGLSYDEIAEVLELPLGTIKSRLYRARLALRGLLQPLLDSVELP